MQTQRTLKISALALGILLLSLSFNNAAFADKDKDTKRQFLIGTGLICNIDASFCPDVASAANGDKLFLAGSGSFNTNPSEKAKGGGSFVHLSSDGTLRGFGTWTAKEVISWTPGSFNDLGGVLPEDSQGGVAVLKVHINPATGGAGFDAVLTIFCALPPIPPSPEEEGITLNIPGVIDFGTIAGGNTLFIQP